MLRCKLIESLRRFIAAGKPIIGICNGFQILVKSGLLPGNSAYLQEASLVINDSGKFEDRWVYLAPQSDKCVFIEPGRQIYLPIAHGEGKVVTKDQATLELIRETLRVKNGFTQEKRNKNRGRNLAI